MKHLLLSIAALLLFINQTNAQHNPETVSFRKIKKEKSAKLHADYPKVAQVEFKSCKTVHERHEKVDKAWHDLWHNFTEYYHKQGLQFEKKKRLFVHLHFSETGHLDYFGYHFKGKETDKTKKFVSLFKDYIKDHDFGISEGVKFSQCGELHLLPHQGVKEGM